jgi:hypothetical protein
VCEGWRVGMQMMQNPLDHHQANVTITVIYYLHLCGPLSCGPQAQSNSTMTTTTIKTMTRSWMTRPMPVLPLLDLALPGNSFSISRECCATPFPCAPDVSSEPVDHIGKSAKQNTNGHTHTHTHTLREREREVIEFDGNTCTISTMARRWFRTVVEQ